MVSERESKRERGREREREREGEREREREAGLERPSLKCQPAQDYGGKTMWRERMRGRLNKEGMRLANCCC